MRRQYEQKVQDIGNHTVKALSNIGETGDLRKQRDKLEKELRDTESKLIVYDRNRNKIIASLHRKIGDLEDKKTEIELEIANFKAQLAKLLRDNDIPSESDLSSQV